MKNSVIEAIAANAQAAPDKLCFADESHAYSYAQAYERVVKLAHCLQEMGVAGGENVVVKCTQDTDFVICGLAIQLAGGVFVPVEQDAVEERVRSILEETGSGYAIGLQQIEAPGVKFLPMRPGLERYDGVWNGSFPEPDRTAEILFSTGTTGKSKGIELTHASVTAVADNVVQGVKMKPDNIELIPMPLSHSHSLRRYYANMCNGSSAVFLNGVAFVKKVFDMIDRFQVTAIDLAPSALDILLKFSKDRLSAYRDRIDYIQLGSAPLKEESKHRLCCLLPYTRLYNFYGSTESGCSCILDFNEEKERKGCIGKPTAHAVFIVVDEDRNIINSSPERPGFLACAGEMNMKGYWKQPELTRSVMQNGYIYSNDLGYIDSEGYIYMLGRKDDVINYGGIKIAPEEIEEAVLKYDAVKDCACVPAEEEDGEQVPKLYVVEEGAGKLDMAEFQAFLYQVIDSKKMPRRIEIIEEIPRTYNGKIKRNELSRR